MKSLYARLTSLTAVLSVSAPTALWAHDGHAGHHGWLAGAAQPLLSMDHFLAALVVAIGVAIGVAAVAVWGKRRRRFGF